MYERGQGRGTRLCTRLMSVIEESLESIKGRSEGRRLGDRGGSGRGFYGNREARK